MFIGVSEPIFKGRGYFDLPIQKIFQDTLSLSHFAGFAREVKASCEALQDRPLGFSGTNIFVPKVDKLIK